MKKSEKIQNIKYIIWFNLFIGIYNLYMFNELNSIFHLVLGSMNIGVWVFCREKYLNFSFVSLFKSTEINKDKRLEGWYRKDRNIASRPAFPGYSDAR